MHWTRIAREQDGVVSRRQLAEAGLDPHDLRRLLRRRDLAPLHRGVFVTHTGEPTWRQRAWGAVLHAEPAALWGPSALDAVRRGRGPGPSLPVHVAIDGARRTAGTEGVVIHRVTGLAGRVRWRSLPPRMRTEEAVVDAAASARDEFAAVAALTDAVQARLTTPGELARVLSSRTRVARRSLLAAVVADLDAGTDSVLEHGFLTRVERPHGLPQGRRQARLAGLAARYDVLYEAARVIVELDGRTYHSLARDRYADLERDVEAAVTGHLTVRLGWGQVFSTSCATAERLAALMKQRGWSGCLRRCPSCP